MKINTTSIIFLFLTSLVVAQDLEITPVDISGSPVGFLGMAQDKYGYIWLSDNGNGLYKYDGKTTVNYRSEPANPNSLSSNRIENVIIDKEGILWLAHFGAGIDRFDSEAGIFTNFSHNESDTTSLCSNGTRDIIEDLDGNLWVGTNKGLDKFDKETGKFTHHISNDPDAAILREEQIRKLYLDKSGIIWIGTGSAFFSEESAGGLFSLNPRTGEINLYRHTEEENSLKDNRVRAIFEDSRSVFWIGTAGDGLHTMNRENGTFTRHTYDPKNPKKLSRPAIRNEFSGGVDHITFIGEDNEESIWIGTFENGVNRYNPNTETTDHYSPNEFGQFKTDNFSYWGFLKSNDGLLWFVSFNSGNNSKLSMLDISSKKQEFYEQENISAFNQGKDSTFYFGKIDGVQVLENGKLNYVFKTYDTKGENGQRVTEICSDMHGNIWAGTVGAGLFYYDQETKEIRNYRHEAENDNSLSNDNLGSILIQENGEIFVGTSDGLDILNLKTNQFEHFELKNTIFNQNFSKSKLVAVDGQKNIWVGGRGGIYRLERNKGAFIKYNLGLGSEIITDLYIDVEGLAWITTVNHGLRRYNRENDFFESILDETGFLNKYSLVVSITQDRNKNMWLSNYRNLIKYDITSNQGTLFSEDWVSGNGRISYGDLNTLSSGEILLWDQSGYIRFDPNSFIKPDSAVQEPFIEKLIIGEKVVSAGDDKKLYESFRINSTIELSHDQNDLSFEIGYIDFGNDQQDRLFSYKLENYDKVWRGAKSGERVTYYQLSPGQYALLIKAQDTYGNWGETELSIHIATPWYKTLWAYMMYVLLFIGGIIVVHRYQRKRLLEKAREEAREKELEQAKEIEKAYTKLKSTQAQLIQSEKMASLGELTAGIAHEIQNPLNFVNNFSEINKELIEDAEEELAKGDLDEVRSIFHNLKSNEEKINQHGRRADSIVKGMLMHSRSNKGEKIPTDINALCDEFLRLSYHGLRAKDRNFNADFETHFDATIPKINIIPQDMGRVLLNLINNAFCACADRSVISTVSESHSFEVSKSYKPKVIVETKLSPFREGQAVEYDQIQIIISDNGPGIPEDIKDKIFQPFFTTKPTGQGTGLGLSLAYDIIKAHNGNINVDSQPDKGSIFTILLPLK